MKFKNLVFSLLIISSSLNMNASISSTESTTPDDEIEYYDEDVESDTQGCDNQIREKSIRASIEEASVEMLFSTLDTVEDLKTFYKKHPNFVVGSAAVALAITYKLVKRN